MKLPSSFPLTSAFPLKRIVFALLLSVLAHSLLLWHWPKFDTDPDKKTPLPLQVKLEPLPLTVKKSAKKKAKISKHEAAPAAPVISQDATEPTTTPEPIATDTPIPFASINEPPPPPLLPKHAQLIFSVQYGSGTFKVGEIIHTLDIIDGHYSLHAESKTTGLTSLLKNYALTQTSTGTINTRGLQPEYYEEAKKEGGEIKISNARFDWNAEQITFANGRSSKLAALTQDTLSLPYHLSQLPLNMEMLTISLSNGKNIARYNLTVGNDETIATPMGELRTIALHKVRGTNEDGLIIWLALEYRLLPVKIQYLDKSGAIAANMIITDIRVSDE